MYPGASGRVATLAAILSLSACAQQSLSTPASTPAAERSPPLASEQTMPIVRIGEDIEPHDQARVTVRGTYRLADVRKRQGGDPVYHGHAVVELLDGQYVFLEPTWSEAAIRTEGEREQFVGTEVEAVGILHRFCPTPPTPAAAIISPCLTPVERVESAE